MTRALGRHRLHYGGLALDRPDAHCDQDWRACQRHQGQQGVMRRIRTGADYIHAERQRVERLGALRQVGRDERLCALQSGEAVDGHYSCS